MKRCLPHNATDNRNKNRGKQRGIAALCALSLCVALGAFTVLSAPAIALTEDKAEELGIELAAEATPETAAVAPLAETEQAPAALLTGDMSVTLNKVDAETGEETPDATITLTCTEDAAVPADATLDVRELEPGSDEYNDYCTRTVQALAEKNGVKPESVVLNNARFFDVTILVEGEKFEPAAPVQVNITYAEPTAPATTEVNTERKVVHFAAEDDGTETTEVLDTEVAKAEDGTEIVKYEQASFSVTGDAIYFIEPRDAEGTHLATDVPLPGGGGTFTSNKPIGVSQAAVVDGHTVYKQGTYNPETGYYEDTVATQFRLDFNVDPQTFSAEDDQSYNYFFDLPDHITVPDTLCNDWKPDEEENFYYRFYKSDDGKAHLMVRYIAGEFEDVTGNTACYVAFDATLGTSYLHTEADNPTVTFGTQEVTVQVTPSTNDHTAKYDASVTKKGSYLAAGDATAKGGYIYYTVDVTSIQGTKDAITVKDGLTTPEGLTIGSPMLDSVEKIPLISEYGNWKEDTAYTTTIDKATCNFSATGTDFTMTLPQVVHNTDDPSATPTRYRVTYKYPITSDVGEVVKQAGNEVNITDTAVVDHTNTTVSVSKTMLKKTGSYNASTGKVTWTITVNPNHANIAGFKLSDLQLGNAVDGAVTVKENGTNTAAPAGEYTLNLTDNEITFNAVGETTQNTKSYVITYSTPVTPTLGGTTKNDVTIEDKDDNEQGSSGATVGIGGGSVAKACTGINTADKTLGWTSTITVPDGGIAAGTVITDILTNYSYDSPNPGHFFSAAQVKALYTTLTEKLGGKDGAKFAWCDVYKNWTESTFDGSGDFTDAEKIYGFRFTTGADVAKPESGTIALPYTTTFDPGDSGMVTYYNNIKVGDLPEVNAKQDYLTPVDKANYGNPVLSDPTNGYFYWYVQVARDPNADADQKFTIVDTMPQDVLVDSVYFGVSNSTRKLTDGVDAGKLEFESKNNKVVFGEESDGTRTGTVTQGSNADSNKLKLIQDTSATIKTITTEGGVQQQVVTLPVDASAYTPNRFYVVYKCKLNEATITKGDDETWVKGKEYHYTRENSVTVTLTGGGTYGGDTSQTEITVKVPEVMPLDKTGTWNDEKRLLTYTVLINPEQKKFEAGTDGDGKITLTDELKYYYIDGNSGNPFEFTLLPHSVSLYYAVPDESGGWQKDGTNYKTGAAVPAADWGVAFDTSEAYNWYYSTITATIPDEKALVLTYQYEATNRFDKTEDYSYGLNPSNTATLQDAGNKQVTNTVQGKWSHSSSSAGSDKGYAYTINKVEAGKQNVVLGGAEFTVYKYNTSSAAFEATETVYTTKAADAKTTPGAISIVWDASKYAYNTAYYAVETKAPGGYKIPEDGAQKIYFYFSKDSAGVPTGFPTGVTAVDLTKASAQAFIENEKTEVPSYTLPETGGAGTAPYLFGGLVLMGVGALGLRKKRKAGR